jgi:DNA-3-methyladenine glycosylase
VLARPFFARPAPEVARDLIGAHLVSDVDGLRAVVRIVEAEAYAREDPASHSHRGLTRRNATMFQGPGRLYVYLIYGMHHCLNLVTGRVGEGSAVLLRAAEPLEGLEVMAERRGTTDVRKLCSGPGRLGQAMGLDRRHDGLDVVGSDLVWLEPGGPPGSVEATPRIGVSRGTEAAWRFVEAGPWSSRSSRPSTPRS